MLNIFQLLNTPNDSSIYTGVVEEFLGKRKYKVRVKSRSIVLKSAIEEQLKIGTYVVVNKTKYDKYIVGVSEIKKTKLIQEEVIVDG